MSLEHEKFKSIIESDHVESCADKLEILSEDNLSNKIESKPK